MIRKTKSCEKERKRNSETKRQTDREAANQKCKEKDKETVLFYCQVSKHKVKTLVPNF